MTTWGSVRTRAITMACATVVLTIAALVMQLVGGPPDFGETLLPLAFAGLGYVVATRAPGNRIGWLFLGVALLMSAGQGGDSLFYLARDRFDAIPLAKVVTLATGWMWFPTLSIMATFCLLLFPDGHLPSPRWRVVGWLAGLGIGLGTVTMFGFSVAELDALVADPNSETAGPPVFEVIIGVIMGAVFIAFVGCIASLFVRWRNSSGVPRQQLKWFALGGAVQLLGIGANFVDRPVGLLVSEVTVLALPVAAAIAITRYRLFDIDRILSRTVAYTILTALLLTVYLAAVTVLTALTSPLAGKSPLAVAAATLLAAAAFGPARRSIQTAVDQRFNRARYDAARTAEAYRSRLRDQLDLDEIRTDLVTTARSAVQPATALLWLRPPEAHE